MKEPFTQNHPDVAPPCSPDHQWRTLFCSKCGHSITVQVDCRKRFCVHCSRRRSRRIRNRLHLLFEKTEKQPKAGFRMVTLSKANCSELDAGIRDLVSSFRRLRQRSFWKTYVLGGAFVIEIKGRPGNWHPHIHAIVYSYYIPWERLRSSWMQCSGGHAVWISVVSTDKAIGYVTKYVTKCDLPAALLDDVGESLRRFRLFTRFGMWHNIVLPKLIFEYPCQLCGRSDWIVDFTIERLIRYS